eukprot:5431972-Heterocapsa_arctica.AAC.2
MEQGKSQVARDNTVSRQDSINTAIGIKINSYLRQEDEKEYMHIWTANRSFLEDVKVKGTSMGPKTSDQMTNESLVIDDHEIQDNLSDLHHLAALQLAHDCGWLIPEGTRIV